MDVVSAYSVGHSNRTIEAFASLLVCHDIELLVDVRTFPGSRYCPHFNAESLRRSLGELGIAYEHLPDVGGRRRSVLDDSPNGGWQNASFRSYADHMGTDGFESGMSRLVAEVSSKTTAFMCSEAVWWRCHRRMISDALVVRGIRVLHIMGEGRFDEHRLTEFAKVDGESIVYPPPKEAAVQAKLALHWQSTRKEASA